METANLILRTWDILPQNQIVNGTDNGIGSIYGNGCVLTWKNLDLQQIIGLDMWNKYERFNFVLRCYGYRPTTPNAGTTDPNPHKNASIWISGFSFTNSKTQNCIATQIMPSANTDGLAVLNCKNSVSFDKLKQFIDLTVEIKTSHSNTVDGFSEKPNFMVGHHTFIFSIVGCTRK